MNKQTEQQVEQVVPNNVAPLRELDTLKREMASIQERMRATEDALEDARKNLNKVRENFRTRNRDFLEVSQYVDELQKALVAWTAFAETCVSESVHNLPAFKAAKAATAQAMENAPW